MKVHVYVHEDKQGTRSAHLFFIQVNHQAGELQPFLTLSINTNNCPFLYIQNKCKQVYVTRLCQMIKYFSETT